MTRIRIAALLRAATSALVAVPVFVGTSGSAHAQTQEPGFADAGVAIPMDKIERLIDRSADRPKSLRGLQVRTQASAIGADADPVSGLNIDIPATKIILKNGLTLVVHEDHSAPLVAVNIWYHVGSKNEPKGRSGFAHLFEHLMFNGSENFNGDFFKATQKIGASEQNGTTWWDRTNYYQTVPKGALDSILWLESDRMGHLLGAIDQAKLDEQRSVVKNEKRQGDNSPYAAADDLVIRATTPQGHPYDHSTIGSMEDLDAASLDNVKEWFRAWYGPSNAVLVLAGDITPDEARAKVDKYFGDIAPGAPVIQPQRWIPKMSGTVREKAYDRVSQAKLIRTWNVAEYISPDSDHLQFLSALLAGDKNSRLYKRLVIDEQLATSVEAGLQTRELGGQFQIEAMVKPGKDITRVEAIVDEELKRLIETGPTAAEMARVRTSTLASFARSLEGVSSKASQLAESEVYYGRYDGWKLGFERFKNATPADIQRVGKTWLTDGDYVLHMLPFGEMTANSAGADRTKMPMPEKAVAATFPLVERATLPNGMNLVVARRAGIPVVNFTMLVNTGTPADFAVIAPGTGGLAMNLMDEGTTTRSGEQIVAQSGGLGAKLSTGGGGETSFASLSALKPALKASLALYADVVMNPAFRQSDIERLKGQTVAGIAAAKQDPGQAVRRVLPKLVFGADNAYGQITTEAAIQSIGRPQVAAFHSRWFHPNNATLIVTGDTTLADVRPQVEAAFAAWKQAPVPERIAPRAAPATKSTVYLIDKPGAPQSVIRAALLAPPRIEGDEIAREAMNTTLGGSFTSRINMKLREEKGWAYGAGSGLGGGGRGARLFSASASVQADKTAESMSEIAVLLRGVTSDRPINAAEFASAKDTMSLGLSSDWSTSDGVAQYLADQIATGLADDYWQSYPEAVTSKNLDEINAAGSALLANRPLIWLVAGDRAKIESKVRALNLGELRVIDADGNPVN